MIDLTDFSEFIAKELKADAEFITYCNDELGKQLNYNRDNLMIADTELPYLTVLTFAEKHERTMDEWTLQIQIGILASLDLDILDGIEYIKSMDDVRRLGKKALERIDCLLRDKGIKPKGATKYEKSIEIDQWALVPHEAGETNEENTVSLTIVFQKSKLIGA